MINFCRHLARAIVAAALLLSPTPSSADCIGCFDVIKVRAEFRDGSSRDMFLVHYPSSSPLYTDPDSSLVVSLEMYYTSHYFNGRVSLLESIYQFEGITTATTQADIDSIDVSTLTRLVYLQDMKFGAWGTINVYTPRVLELLSRTPVARYECEDTGQRILLSYDPSVTEEDLRHLDELRGWESGKGQSLRSNMKALCNQLKPVISDNSANYILADELNALYERLLTIDSLVRTGPVGEYVGTIRGRILARLDYLKAVRTLFQYNRRELAGDATDAINHVLASSVCDTTRTLDHVENGRWDSLACMFEQCSGIWLDNEHDYKVLLENENIVEVFNDSD